MGIRMKFYQLYFKLRAPFGVLQQLLGPPDDDDVPEKCSTCWFVPMPDDAAVDIMVKDWRDEDDRSFKVNVFRDVARRRDEASAAAELRRDRAPVRVADRRVTRDTLRAYTAVDIGRSGRWLVHSDIC
jgi:hypothetical protein